MLEFIEYLTINDPVSLMPEDPRRLERKYKLVDADVSENTAIDRIRNHDELLKYMFAAYILRAHGNRKQVKLAKRIDQLCQLHPEFGQSASAVRAHMSNELGEK